MSYFRFKQGRLAGAVLCASLLAASAMAVAAGKALAPPTAALKLDPEQLLTDIYKDLAENNLRQAQQKADALVEAYPTFRLGHLVRGDLLLMHTRAITHLGSAPNGAEGKLQDLRQEAAVRLSAGKAEPARPGSTLLPRALLQMRKDQRHALIVDAKRSRVYLYENRNGQIRYVNDYYFS